MKHGGKLAQPQHTHMIGSETGTTAETKSAIVTIRAMTVHRPLAVSSIGAKDISPQAVSRTAMRIPQRTSACSRAVRRRTAQVVFKL